MKLLTNLIFEPKGKHNPALAYNIKDTVMSADGRCVYFALQDVPVGIALDNAEYWIKMLDVSDIQGGGGAVWSVNGKTGAVELSAEDVGALPSDTPIPDVSDFITRAVSDLLNYYTKSQTYTREEIDQKVSAIPKFTISVVSALPSTGIGATTIYLVPGGADDNLYTEYINVNGTWEILGSQRVDLTGYATQSWALEQLKGYQPKGNYQPAGDYALKSELPTKLSDLSEDSTHRVVTDAEKAAWSGKSNFSGNYADLIGKPTIPTVPTKVSAFENDKGYLTQHQDISHKLDADKLPEAIDDALAQAKASGEFDGKNGYSPVLGVDYWTETDKEEIIDDVSGELSKQIATNEYKKDVAEYVPIVKVADQPTFVNSVDEMTDTSKMYVLKSDGMFYSCKKITTTIPGNKVPNFTNLADPKSSDWKTGYRLNSSGSPTEEPGTTVTNYIPILQNQVIRIKGIDLTTKNCSVSKADKVNIVSSKLSAQSAYFSNISVTTTEASFTVTNANLRWIRFAGVLNGAADDVIVTANQEITYTETPPSTETTYEWSSTGIAYNQPADYEDRVIALEKNAANNSADIDVLKQQIADMGSGAAVTTIPEWWEDEVEDTIAKIKALQVGRNCVTFPFFSDNHQRNGYAGMLIAKVMKECNIPYCFYGGDSISSGIILNEAEMIAQDKAFDTAMSYVPSGRFCRAVGNHDGYWYDGTNKFYYSREQVYELFLREESIAQNKHFGDDGTYYYIDDVVSKVRWIVLNFNDYDDAQLAWLDTALTFPESGWGVVFISHAPITSHYGAYTAKDAAVRTKLKNYINGSATNKAVVIGWFGGHIHRDRIFNGVASNPGYDGSTDPTTDAATGNPIGETLPWKTITIISDNVAIGYGGVTHAIDNSDQSHAIDFVTINKTTHTVNITRLGFGEDRSYTY